MGQIGYLDIFRYKQIALRRGIYEIKYKKKMWVHIALGEGRGMQKLYTFCTPVQFFRRKSLIINKKVYNFF